MLHRRSFLLGLGAAVAAPAIIRPGFLMPVKQMWPVHGDGVALTAIAHPDVFVAFNLDQFTRPFSVISTEIELMDPATHAPGSCGIVVGAIRGRGFHIGDVVKFREQAPSPS